MMTQSVMTQATNLLGSAKESVTSKSKQTGSGFDFFMNRNLKSGLETSGITEASSDKKKVVQSKNTSYDKKDLPDQKVQKSHSTETADKTPEATKTADEVTDSKETVKTSVTEKTDVTKEAAVTKETDETTSKESQKINAGSEDEESKKVPQDELIAQILGMLQQVREAVMEILQITPEELDQLIAKYSDQNGEISTVDLLQPGTLKQLVLVNSGKEDLFSVLTDENLADTMKQLVQAVDQIKVGADLPFTMKQIQSILEQTKAQSAAVDSFVQQTTDNSTTILNEVDKNGQVVSQDIMGNKEQAKAETSLIKEHLTSTTKLPISNESSAQTQADTKKDDNRNLETTDSFQTFMDKMVQATQTTQTTQTTQVDFSGNLVQVTELRDIANQIIEHIKVVVKPEQTSMELQLNPEQLGKVNLNIQSKNGVMTAQFIVQNESCKEAIEGQLHTLRETLNQQGIKVDSIEVTVSANAFEQSAGADQDNQPEEQKNQSGRKISLEDAIAMSELPNEGISIHENDELRGSQIDYTA